MKDISKILTKITTILEYVIATFLILCVIVQGLKLFLHFGTILQSDVSGKALVTMLSYAFNLVIVLEFLRMLIKHSMENVTEVLIFTMARYIIIEHLNNFSLLLSIIGIIALLASRKIFAGKRRLATKKSLSRDFFTIHHYPIKFDDSLK